MKKASNNYPIDVVIPWVDNQDEKWQKEKMAYGGLCDNNEGVNDARFRDWGTLKYVIRSIYQYAPWVHMVYIVTCGQKPVWFNENNNKVKIINHKDFIPQEYLPTFCANAIELNIHRIKGLSENFIFFNDDIVLVNKTRPEDFFRNGLPCDTAVLNTHCGWRRRLIYNIAFNDTAVINDHFNFKKTIKENKWQWINYKYGLKNNMQNLVLMSCPRFPGFKHFHMTNSFTKSAYEKMWKIEKDELHSTCMDKFRSKNHVNQWLIREYQLVTGNFYPSAKYKIGKMIDFEKDGEDNSIINCKKSLFGKKYKMVCINDGDDIQNLETIKEEISELLKQKFPNKAACER